jgi:hypothetical protein
MTLALIYHNKTAYDGILATKNRLLTLMVGCGRVQGWQSYVAGIDRANS